MKRQKLNKNAKLSAVKLNLPDGETFRQLVDRINGDASLSLVFYAAVVAAILLLGKEGGGEFIYFQF